MTISDLAKRSHLTEKHVKSRIETVPGLTMTGGEYVIPEDSRFPFDVSHFKKFNFGNCRYIILKATDEKRYVCAEMLHCTQAEFDTIIAELVEAKYLRAIDTTNTYGANGYMTTIHFDAIKQEGQEKIIKIVTETIKTLASAGSAVLAASK